MVPGCSPQEKRPHDPPDPSSEPPRTKRQCVIKACTPCRNRKSKCDGKLGCEPCKTRRTECFFSDTSEKRRRIKSERRFAPRKQDTHTSESSDTGAVILNLIRTLPDVAMSEVIQRIRADSSLKSEDLLKIAEPVVPLTANPSASRQPSLESDLSILLGKSGANQTSGSKQYGHTSGLSLVQEKDWNNPVTPSLENMQQNAWTSVTKDMEFIESLVELYLEWSHAYYVIFPPESFRKDFKSGRQKYCSPLLVNAICSFACHFTDDPRGRTDPTDFHTAGNHFFEEARRLLYEDETSSLTTIQALAIMAMREPAAGRDSSGFAYMGRCMRMALEMGLHLDCCTQGLEDPDEIAARKVTFWGIFTVDVAWSICIGRLSQIPRTAITMKKPSKSSSALTPGSRVFLYMFSTLSEIISDNLFIYYAPLERFTSQRLLDLYQRYTDWYNKLPAALCLPADDRFSPIEPHITTLHMYYHTIILHLFRPFLNLELKGSEVQPRHICHESANKISQLLRLYKRHNRLRACHLVLTHIIFSACVMHLVPSTNPDLSLQYLTEGLEALEDISTCHYFGACYMRIIYELTKMWKLPFPDRILKTSTLLPRDTPSPVPLGNPATHADAATSGDEQLGRLERITAGRQESLSIRTSGHRQISMSVEASPRAQNSAIASPMKHYVADFAPTNTPNPAIAPIPLQDMFQYFPGNGFPLFQNDLNPPAPMALDNVLLGPGNPRERLDQDGFTPIHRDQYPMLWNPNEQFAGNQSYMAQTYANSQMSQSRPSAHQNAPISANMATLPRTGDSVRSQRLSHDSANSGMANFPR